MNLDGREAIASGDMRKTDQRLHERQLPRMLQLEARDAFAIAEHGRVGELEQLASVNEGFQDVLLDVEIPIADTRELFTQSRQIPNGFADSIVGDVVRRRFGAQVALVANVLLDEAILVVAAPCANVT